MSTDAPIATAPAYQRIRDHLFDHIRRGDWSPGDRLPSEHDLKEQFGVSRMTIRRALRELVDEGYVSRVVGAGTYVTDRSNVGATLPLHCFSAEARRTGLRHRMRLLTASPAIAPASVARQLRLGSADRCFHTIVVGWVGNWPVQLEERWVAIAEVPGFEQQNFTDNAPALALARVLPTLTYAHEIRAVVPSGPTRSLLAVARGDPCLLVSEFAYLDGKPVSVAEIHYPGSRYALPGRFL